MYKTRQSRCLAALALAALLSGPGPDWAFPTPQNPSGPAQAQEPKRNLPRARKAYKRGLRAEQAENWSAAYAAYAEAATYAPNARDYLLRREAARLHVVQQHTDLAERDALAGRVEDARKELRQALTLDPSFSAARERLEQFETLATPNGQKGRAGGNDAGELAGPVKLSPQPGVRDFDFRGDTRGGYEEVARQFGVVASFDSEMPTRQARLQVKQADFNTAMMLLGQETNTFWVPVDARTFFVAQNNQAKRRQYAPHVVRTVVLPNSVTPDKMTETMRLIREIAGIHRIELDTRTHTLTLRDTPETVALAMGIIAEIEPVQGELMLEIEILEVNRNAARKLGITPPSASQLITFSEADIRAVEQAKNTSELLAIVQRVFGTTVPPVVALGGGRSLFLVTVPGAAATFSKTLSLVRSGRRVLLRASDGQPATLFVGERFPVTLAVLGESLLPGRIDTAIRTGQTTFPRTDFATGTAPVGVISADFNGDGRPDLAVVNKTSNTVSILLGRPDGTFGPKTDFPTGNGPVALAVGDFNDDGRLDLAVVNQTDNTVSILLGNGTGRVGDGTFGPKKDFPTGAGPSAVAVGDLNADGRLDLAISNQTDNTVSILLGNGTGRAGDGTFGPKKDFPTGAGPSAVAVRDFNADGRLDLAITNQTDNTVSVLLGNGTGSTADGTFAPKTDFPTGKGPSAIGVGDFNGDGRLDLAITNQTDGTVSVLLGDGTGNIGNGRFGARNDFNVGTTPAAVVVNDFNVDNRLDLAVANKGSNTVSILLGNGDGTFGARLDVATSAGPSSMASADFDGDGRPDLAVANQGANTVSVILNTANFAGPGFNAPQIAFPASQYEDLGLKVRATPRIHDDGEVTLQMEFEIRSLSGVSFNGIPVISNRTVQQTVRLREDEPTMLTGLFQEQEGRTVSGLPGFSRNDVVGHLAGLHGTEVNDTELLILITPRQLRTRARVGRTIYAGRGAEASGTSPSFIPGQRAPGAPPQP